MKKLLALTTLLGCLPLYPKTDEVRFAKKLERNKSDLAHLLESGLLMAVGGAALSRYAGYPISEGIQAALIVPIIEEITDRDSLTRQAVAGWVAKQNFIAQQTIISDTSVPKEHSWFEAFLNPNPKLSKLRHANKKMRDRAAMTAFTWLVTGYVTKQWDVCAGICGLNLLNALRSWLYEENEI